MSNILLVLDECGLAAPTPSRLFDVIFNLSKGKVRRYAELLGHALNQVESEYKPDPMDVFNFMASSAIRGDSGCAQPSCQLNKLRTLSRFAALYADQMVIPIEFFCDNPNDADDRLGFFRSVNALCHLRPLIEAGIVQLARKPTECICKTCLLKKGVGIQRIEAEAKRFWRQRVEDFTLVYRPPADHERPKLEVIGPPEFLPHGGLEVNLREPLAYAAKRTKLINGLPGIVIPAGKAAEHNLLAKYFFSEFEADLIAQQLYGLQFGATYLTDLPGEAEFFGDLTPRDEAMANAARFCSHLAHSVPLFSDVPIRKVVQIRAHEPEAFIQYRSALNNIIRDHVRPGTFVGPSHAMQLYHDVLRPRIAKLKSDADSRISSARRKATAKVACSFAAITLGVVSGLLPADLAKLFTAVGGVSLLRDIGEALADVRRKPTEIRNSDLYFLLELDGAARSHQ